MIVIITCIVGLGMYPRPLLDEAQPALTHLQSVTTDAALPRSLDARTPEHPLPGHMNKAAHSSQGER